MRSLRKVDVGIEPKRVLFFGKKKSRSCCTGALVDALRANGMTVRWVNCALLRRWIGKRGMQSAVRLIRKLFDPDLCFVFFHDLPPLLMQEFSAEVPTVVWMEELIGAETDPRVSRGLFVDYARGARLLCLSTPDLVRGFREAGIEHSTFLMSGFSPRYHRPHASVRLPASSRFVRDLTFIGGPGYTLERVRFLDAVSQNRQLEVFGLKDSWLPYVKRFPSLRVLGEARPRAYAEACARSKIVLGLNQSHEHTLYFSNRIFLTLACRGFHLTHYVPGMEDVFEDGVHLAWFKDLDECLDKIDYYLARDELRDRIALQGHELVVNEHAYSNRVADILAILRNETPLCCPESALNGDAAATLGDRILHPSKEISLGRPTGSTNT